MHLYVLSNDGNLLWPGAGLPYGRDNEDWVFNDFTIPDGVTWIRLGVLWVHTRGVAEGDEFYLNEVALFKHQDDDYFAGFEASDRVTEATAFDNYHVGRITSAGVYATSGSSSYVLTGSSQVANAIIGPAKNLKVYPGDVVRAEAYARFLGSQGGSTNIAGALAGALQAAFGLASGGATDVPFQAVDNLFGTGPLIGTAAFPSEDEYAPDAYLNYILFDESFVPYDFGYDQISADAVIPNAADRLSIVAKVTKPGYIYIYLSNEAEVAQEVYFDNFAIKHVRGVAEQGNDYYPFGLTFNSYQRENSLDQRYLYNGKEKQDELNLGWLDFEARYYDAAIGRFLSIDPLSDLMDSWNPYHFTFNNPIKFTDPSGMIPIYQDQYIAATFIRLDGTIVEHRDDNDPNIYLVTDEESWDRNGRTKDGLARVGIENPDHEYVAGEKINLANVGHNLLGYATGRADPDYTIEGFVLPVFGWMKYLRLAKIFGKGGFIVTEKIAKQMAKRGWTDDLIDKTISRAHTTRKATNKATGNPATAYFRRDGSYVVVDDVTKDVIQVSNRNAIRDWVPDASIVNPYIPKAIK